MAQPHEVVHFRLISRAGAASSGGGALQRAMRWGVRVREGGGEAPTILHAPRAVGQAPPPGRVQGLGLGLGLGVRQR